MIRSFADRDAEALFHGRFARRPGADLQRVAQRKLRQLHSAEALRDLTAPPGNRLERLRGDRAGRHSIRINDQWRICFVWTDTGPRNVEIVDYHRG
jgi:proteic killer suppression protein